jgi:uncharacterized integral membrane protein
MSEVSRTGKRRISAGAIVAIVLAILGIIFIVQNTASSSIHFLFWTFSTPMWIWLAIVLLVGVVIGSLFPWFRPKKKAQGR